MNKLIFTSTLLLMTIAAGASPARAQHAPSAGEPGVCTTSSQSALPALGEARQGLAAREDLSPDAPAPTAEATTSPPLSRRTEAEVKLTRSLVGGTEIASKDGFVHFRSILVGIEPEPMVQYQLRREVLFLLARVTGEQSLARAGTTLSRRSSIRAFTEAVETEQVRTRATYVEIERSRLASPVATTIPAQIAFGSAGTALFAGSAVAGKLAVGPTGVYVYPVFWPVGFNIKGSFRSL